MKSSLEEVVSRLQKDEQYKILFAKAFAGTLHQNITEYAVQKSLAEYEKTLISFNSRFDELNLQQLITDLKNVRTATNSFIDSLSEEQLKLKGFAWKYELTVEEFLKATIGHEIHHINIIKERYLK